MIIYTNTERELFMEDYRPISCLLHGMALPDLIELRNNLSDAADNAFCYGSSLLEIALDMDIKKVDMYIKMRQKKQAKQA